MQRIKLLPALDLIRCTTFHERSVRGFLGRVRFPRDFGLRCLSGIGATTSGQLATSREVLLEEIQHFALRVTAGGV